jgi:hypothetical protein
MLNDAEVAARVARQRHLPGWGFTTRMGEEGLILRIEPRVYDADTMQETVLGIDTYLPPMRDERAVDEFIHWRLQRIALHEVNEQHRVDGKPVHPALHNAGDQ